MTLPKIKRGPRGTVTRREFGAFLKASTTSEFNGTYCVPDPRTAGLIEEISAAGNLKRIAKVCGVADGRAAGLPILTATIAFNAGYVGRQTPSDFLEIVARRLAKKFHDLESEAYTTGDGLDCPRGIYDYGLRRRGKGGRGLGYITTPGGRVPNSDDVYNLMYAVSPQRLRQGVYICHQDALPLLASLKNADGRYHYEAPRGEECGRLFGYPCRVIEGMQSPQHVDACPVAFGDFRAGYRIDCDPEIRIWRNGSDGRVEIVAERALQGGVVDFESFCFLKFTATRAELRAAR